jgi:hypothetical protein
VNQYTGYVESRLPDLQATIDNVFTINSALVGLMLIISIIARFFASSGK